MSGWFRSCGPSREQTLRSIGAHQLERLAQLVTIDGCPGSTDGDGSERG
jgi:hypothetical protein